MSLSVEELRSAIESILLVAGEPVKIDDLLAAFPESSQQALEIEIEAIRSRLDHVVGGIVLEHTAGGYRFATRAVNEPYLRKFFARPREGRLSLAALESLAIIAYRQPITVPEISGIRGVNSTGVLRTLLDKRMIRIAGRKAVVGSPFLYRTTREFLVHFGLNDIQDLPRLEEFGDILGETVSDELLGITIDDSTEQTVLSPTEEQIAAAGVADDAWPLGSERRSDEGLEKPRDASTESEQPEINHAAPESFEAASPEQRAVEREDSGSTSASRDRLPDHEGASSDQDSVSGNQQDHSGEDADTYDEAEKTVEFITNDHD